MSAGVALITAVLLLATAAPAGGGVGQGGEASGEPVKVMTIGTLGTAEGATTAIEQVMLAAEGFIDDHGGLGTQGQQVEATFCNDQDNPNGAEQCARQAVDEGFAAVVGGYSIAGGDEILAVLEPAGIPWLGLGIFGFGAQTSPMSYPTIGGSATEWEAIGQTAGKEGCETAGTMRWDAPSGLVSMDHFRSGLESEGGQVTQTASVGFTATDLAPAVAIATDGTDCVAIGMSPEQGPLAIQAIQQAGIETQVVSYPDAVSEQSVEETGGEDSPGEGLISASWFPAADSRKWKQAKNAVEKYADDPDVVDFTQAFNVQLTWVAYKALVSVTKDLETIDAASLVAALDSAENVKTGGLTPPLQFNTPVVPEDFALSRIFNPFVVLLTIKDGKFTALEDGKFVDTTELMLAYEETPGLLGDQGGGPPG